MYVRTRAHTHTHTRASTHARTDPSSAQVGLNVEFVMERAELQYTIDQ